MQAAEQWMQMVLFGKEDGEGVDFLADEPTLIRLMPCPDAEDIGKCLHELWADQVAALLAAGALQDDGSLVLSRAMVKSLRELQTKPFDKQPKALRERTLSLVRLRLQSVLLACYAFKSAWHLLEQCESVINGFGESEKGSGMYKALLQLFARRMQLGMVLDGTLYVRSVTLLRGLGVDRE